MSKNFLTPLPGRFLDVPDRVFIDQPVFDCQVEAGHDRLDGRSPGRRRPGGLEKSPHMLLSEFRYSDSPYMFHESIQDLLASTTRLWRQRGQVVRDTFIEPVIPRRVALGHQL